MTISSAQFASLLCSRLCHDLLSPVGAVNNGVELLVDERDAAARESYLELLANSARVAAEKLKFFRLAFGAAGGFGEQVDTGEARAAIEGLFAAEGKVDVEWMVEAPDMDKSALKVLLNLALIGGEALVRGGMLAIGAERHSGGTDIVIRAEGQRLTMRTEVRATLEGSTDESDLAPLVAPAWLVRSLVTDAGGQVQVADAGEGVLLLGASLPAAA